MLSKLIEKIKIQDNPIIDLGVILIVVETILLAMDIQIAIPIRTIIRILGLTSSSIGIGLIIWRNHYRQKNLDTIDKNTLNHIAPIIGGIFSMMITAFYLSQKNFVVNNLTFLTIISIAVSTFALAYGVLCENTKPSKLKAQFVIFTPIVIGLLLSLINMKAIFIHINSFTIIIIVGIIYYFTSKPKDHVVNTPEDNL